MRRRFEQCRSPKVLQCACMSKSPRTKCMHRWLQRFHLPQVLRYADMPNSQTYKYCRFSKPAWIRQISRWTNWRYWSYLSLYRVRFGILLLRSPCFGKKFYEPRFSGFRHDGWVGNSDLHGFFFNEPMNCTAPLFFADPLKANMSTLASTNRLCIFKLSGHFLKTHARHPFLIVFVILGFSMSILTSIYRLCVPKQYSDFRQAYGGRSFLRFRRSLSH